MLENPAFPENLTFYKIQPNTLGIVKPSSENSCSFTEFLSKFEANRSRGFMSYVRAYKQTNKKAEITTLSLKQKPSLKCMLAGQN